MKRIDKGLVLRNDLKHQAFAKDIPLPEADALNWKGSHDEYEAKAATVGVLLEKNEEMCIRDRWLCRPCIAKHHTVGSNDNPDVSTVYIAVSYTHLDVYKRQL